MKRRDFIASTMRGATAAWAGTSFLLGACHTEEDMTGEPNWIGEGSFETPLPALPTASGTIPLSAGTDTYEVVTGRTSPTLTYGEGILGPSIIAHKGETVTAVLQNNLQEPTNIHWHGLVVPEDMDGHPRDVAQPGVQLNYFLPINQRAGTYWYHPHPHGMTASQVFMGLAGLFVVRDDEEAALNLPAGEFEIPLILQDKRVDGGALDYSPTEEEIMGGYLGEYVIVNGKHAPVAEIAAGWYRLRVLNGSTARVFNLAFSGGLRYHIIGSDGGLLRAPETVSKTLLAPGERLDILLDTTHLEPGREFYLISDKFSEFAAQGRQSFRIMKFRVTGKAGFDYALPARLSDIATLDPAQAVTTRRFNIGTLVGGSGGHGMGRHGINGKIFEMDHVDDVVEAGSTEMWEFDNTTGDEIHPMHVHGVQFQIVSRKGGRNNIIPAETGWKDTVLVMPGEKVTVIMTFPEYRGVFVLHCHNLEHEDDGMMLNYRII